MANQVKYAKNVNPGYYLKFKKKIGRLKIYLKYYKKINYAIFL